MARGRKVILNSCDVSNGSHCATTNKWTDSMESVHVGGRGEKEREERERERETYKMYLGIHFIKSTLTTMTFSTLACIP